MEKQVKEKFTPYIEEKLINLDNGLIYHKRKAYRTKTRYDYMPDMIENKNYCIEWLSYFDCHSHKYWENYFLSDILTGKKEIPLEHHYGNSVLTFLFNMFYHFPDKDQLISNLDRWSNYYRKHVTDSLSKYSANVLAANVTLQRCGLSEAFKQEYKQHTLEEIENDNIIEDYYRLSYVIEDNYITFYTSNIYLSLPTFKLHFL